MLIGVAIVIAGLDQGSKFLAVKHLTAGIAQAHFAGEVGWTGKGRAVELAELSILDEIRYFYGAIEHPCGKPGAVCRTIDVIDGVWAWRYVQNPGAAWGLLSDASESVRRPFFMIVSVVAVGFIAWFASKLEADQSMLLVALALVLGGAIGNFIDRVHLSYVIDFVDWYAGRHHWPTFNFADAAISTGVGLLLLDMIVSRDPEEAPAPRAVGTEESK